MDGKVEISILQFNKLQDEQKSLTKENEILKEREKMVKLVTVDKITGGFHKYNTWSDRNEFVADDREVETSEYVGLEDAIRVLRDEEEDKVKSEITKVKKANHTIEMKMEELTLNYDKKTKDAVISNKKALAMKDEELEDKDILIEELEWKNKHKLAELKELSDEKIKELQDIIDGKEVEVSVKTMEDLVEEVNKLTSELAKEKANNKPWWRS